MDINIQPGVSELNDEVMRLQAALSYLLEHGPANMTTRCGHCRPLPCRSSAFGSLWSNRPSW